MTAANTQDSPGPQEFASVGSRSIELLALQTCVAHPNDLRSVSPKESGCPKPSPMCPEWTGEKMAPLCAEFGISRKTGYKIYDRYKDCGLTAFTDRSRRPYRQANRLPAPVEATIVRLKREYPGWGAPKIREKLRRQFTGAHLPAISTVHAVLDRHGLVKRRRRRRPRASGTELSRPTQPNALWCADYTGPFLVGNSRRASPPSSRSTTRPGRIRPLR